MATFSSIKTGIGAAAIALAVGLGGMAVPAQAASVTFNFGSPFFHLHFGDPTYFRYCLDDSGIIDRLHRRGYSHIHIIRHNYGDDYDNKVWVVAQDYHGDWYQMRVDRCTHAVDHLHLVHQHNSGNFDFNHFSFSFNF